MANLPGLLCDMKELSNSTHFQPMSDLMSYEMDFNVNVDKAMSDSCPSLDFSPDSFDSLDYINDLQPVDAPCQLDQSACPNATLRAALLRRAQSLKDGLYELGIHMNARLANGTTVIESPAIAEDSPVPTAYHFNSWRDMTGYSCFWSMLILANKVIMRLLPPYHQTVYDLQAECRSVAYEICKTWEDAWASKPIGAFHTGLSFVVAYEYCKPDVQEWIVTGMNSLLDYQMVDAFRWSDEVIAMMSGKLAGEGPDLIFSNVKLSKESV
jgi:hypothetical protein